MDRQPHRFGVHQRVKLVRDALYPLAPHGSEGWVRRRDHDNLGYPMVYIEWDKDHWAYNGEGNEWTMEAHFEPVNMADPRNNDEEPPMDDKLRKVLEDMLAGQSPPRLGMSEPEPHIRNIMERIEWPSRTTYRELVAEAVKGAEDADAFFLLTIRKEGDDLVPVLSNCYLNAESAILLEAQLSRIGALAHSDVASQLIGLIFAEQDKDDSE